MSKAQNNINNEDHIIWPRQYPTWASTEHGHNEYDRDLQQGRHDKTDHHQQQQQQKTKSQMSNDDISPNDPCRYRYGHDSQQPQPQGQRKDDEVISYFTSYPSLPTGTRTTAKCGCGSGESTLICVQRSTSGQPAPATAFSPRAASSLASGHVIDHDGHSEAGTIIPGISTDAFCSAYFNYQNNSQHFNHNAPCQENILCSSSTSSAQLQYFINSNTNNHGMIVTNDSRTTNQLPLSNENFSNNREALLEESEESEQEEENLMMPWLVPLTLVQNCNRHHIMSKRNHRRVKIRNGKSHPVCSEKLFQESSSNLPNLVSTSNQDYSVSIAEDNDSEDVKSTLKSETSQVAVGHVVVEDADQHHHHNDDDGYDTEPDYPPERFNYFDSEIIQKETVESSRNLNNNNNNENSSSSSNLEEKSQQLEETVSDNNYYPTIYENNYNDHDPTCRILGEPCVNKYRLISTNNDDQFIDYKTSLLHSIPWSGGQEPNGKRHDDDGQGGDVIDDSSILINNIIGDLAKEKDSQLFENSKFPDEGNHHQSEFVVMPVRPMPTCSRFCGPDEILKKIVIKKCPNSSTGGHTVIVYKKLRKKPSPIMTDELIYCPLSPTSIPRKCCPNYNNNTILICPSSSTQNQNGGGSKYSKSILRPRNPPTSAHKKMNNSCSRETQVIYYTPKKYWPPSSLPPNYCHPQEPRINTRQFDQNYSYCQPPQNEDLMRSNYCHQGQPIMRQHQYCEPPAGDKGGAEICIFKCTPSTEKTGCHPCHEEVSSCSCCCCPSPSYPCLYSPPAAAICHSKNCPQFSNKPPIPSKSIKIPSPSPLSPQKPPNNKPPHHQPYHPPSSPRPKPKFSMTPPPPPPQRPSKVFFKSPPTLYKPKLSKVKRPGHIPWLSVPFLPILKPIRMPPFTPLQPIPFIEVPRRSFSEPRFSTPILFQPSLPQMRLPDPPIFGKIVPPSSPPPPPTTRDDVTDPPFNVDSFKVVHPPSKISVPPAPPSKNSVPPPPPSKNSVPPARPSKISVPPPPPSKNSGPPPALPKVYFPRMESVPPPPSPPPKNIPDYSRPKISLPKIDFPSEPTKVEPPPLPQFVPSFPDLPTKRMSNPAPTPPAPPSSPPRVIYDVPPVRRPTLTKIIQVPSPPTEMIKVIEPGRPQGWTRPQSPLPNFSTHLQPRSMPPPKMVIRTPSKPHLTDNLTSTPSSSDGDGEGGGSSTSSFDFPPPPRPPPRRRRPQNEQRDCFCPCCRPPPLPPCPKKSRRKCTSISKNAWCSSTKIGKAKKYCPPPSSSRADYHPICHPRSSRRRICSRKRKKCRQPSQYCIDMNMTDQTCSNDNDNNLLLYQAIPASAAAAANSISFQQQLIHRCPPLLGQGRGQVGGNSSLGFGTQMLSTAAAPPPTTIMTGQSFQYPSGSLGIDQMSTFQNPNNNNNYYSAVATAAAANVAAHAQAQTQAGQLEFYGGQQQQQQAPPPVIMQSSQFQYPIPVFCGTPCSNINDGSRSPASIKNWPGQGSYQLLYVTPAPARKLKFHAVPGNPENIGINRLCSSSKRAVTGRKC